MNHSWEEILSRCLENQFGPSGSAAIQQRFEKLEEDFGPPLHHHSKLRRNRRSNALMLAMRYALLEAADDVETEAKRVTTQLLIRITHDIHAIDRLACTGLAYQAITLAASTFEYAVMLASIGDDNQRAEKWLAHPDLKTNIDNVRDRCQLALDKLDAENPGLKDKLGDIYKGMYETLCVFKHGNPNVQKHVARAQGDEGTRFELFPIADRRAIIAAYWAIQGAIRSGWLALVSYTTYHLPDPEGSLRYEALREIINGVNRSFNAIMKITTEKEREVG